LTAWANLCLRYALPEEEAFIVRNNREWIPAFAGMTKESRNNSAGNIEAVTSLFKNRGSKLSIVKVEFVCGVLK